MKSLFPSLSRLIVPRRLLRREETQHNDASDSSTLTDEENNVKYGKDDQAEDPFQTFPDLPVESGNILTFRAVTVGVLCGALVNASNIYLGLKSGWTASANIFAVSFDFPSIAKWCVPDV